MSIVEEESVAKGELTTVSHSPGERRSFACVAILSLGASEESLGFTSPFIWILEQ